MSEEQQPTFDRGSALSVFGSDRREDILLCGIARIQQIIIIEMLGI